jgi:hypothetical protein
MVDSSSMAISSVSRASATYAARETRAKHEVHQSKAKQHAAARDAKVAHTQETAADHDKPAEATPADGHIHVVG